MLKQRLTGTAGLLYIRPWSLSPGLQQAAPCCPSFPLILCCQRIAVKQSSYPLPYFQPSKGSHGLCASSLNPKAWPPELFLQWFLPSLERLISHNFHNTPDTVSFPNQEVLLCYVSLAHGGLFISLTLTHASRFSENVIV